MIFTKQDFTVNDLLEETAELGNDVLILNSNYTAENTEQKLISGYLSFEAMTEFFDDKSGDIFCTFNWDEDIQLSRTLGQFRDFAEKLENKEIPLSRDIEDGYKFANYENIVYNDKYIVLC